MNGDSDSTAEDRKRVLSGSSPIQVRFIGWLVVVCAGGFGGWIWWAASMSTKMDVIIVNQNTQMAATKAVVEDVSRLKEWRIQIDTIGSPVTAKKIEDTRRDLDDLRNRFDIHMATTTKAP